MAQRGRPPKDNTTPPPQNTELFSFDQFAKAVQNGSYLNTLLGNGYWQNPYWMNTLLKMSEGNPVKYKRDEIIEALNNPVQSEKKLREMHLYFYHTNIFYKRIIKYFTSMMLFKYYIQPEGITKEDIQSQSWKRSYNKALKWIRNFDVEHELRLVTETLIGEDVGYYYLRESEEGYNLQKMPHDYCKIVRKVGNLYQYAFNLMYFLRQGAIPIEDFDPFFREQLSLFLEGKTDQQVQTLQYYWIELDVDKAPCFKFNEITSAVIPVFCGAFLDILSISEYKDLIKSKSVMDAVQILVQRIPLKNEKDITKNNPFLIDATTAGNFHTNVKANLPQAGDGQIKLVTTPMSIESIDFKNRTDNKDNIIGFAESSFFKTMGVSELLFNSENASGMGLIKSIMSDETFILPLLKSYESFINRQLKKVTGKYTIKIKFPPITHYNQQEKIDEYLKLAQYGVPVKSLMLCASGLNAPDANELKLYEDFVLNVDEWMPLLSSHTATDITGESGRPVNDSMSDSKENTSEHESNIQKGTGKSYKLGDNYE